MLINHPFYYFNIKSILCIKNRNMILIKSITTGTFIKGVSCKQSLNTCSTKMIRPIRVTISKRGMVAAETILKVAEVKTLNRILYHNQQMLRNGPASLDSLLKYATNIALIDLKVAQHFLTCAYPHVKIPYEWLKRTYPKLKINSHNETVTWDDYLTASMGDQLQKHQFFKDSSISVLTNVKYDSTKTIQPTNLPNDMSMKQTGQQNCDYMIEHNQIQRCFDLKGGKIRPMAGHTYITSDMEKYETISAKIFEDQFSFFKGLGKEYDDFAIKIMNLQKDYKLTWIQRNIELHEFYIKNWSRLPIQSPSMVFHIKPEYEYTENNEDHKYMKIFQGKSVDLMNLEKTQECIIDALIKGGKVVTKNYFSTEAASLAVRARLRKSLLEIPEMCDWLSNT